MFLDLVGPFARPVPVQAVSDAGQSDERPVVRAVGLSARKESNTEDERAPRTTTENGLNALYPSRIGLRDPPWLFIVLRVEFLAPFRWRRPLTRLPWRVTTGESGERIMG
jgi:hypothetical protein